MKINLEGHTYEPEISYTPNGERTFCVDDGTNIGTGNTIEEALENFVGFIEKHQPKWRMPKEIREQVDFNLVNKIECMNFPTLPTCYLSYKPQRLMLRWDNGAMVVFKDNYNFSTFGFSQVTNTEWLRKTADALYLTNYVRRRF